MRRNAIIALVALAIGALVILEYRLLQRIRQEFSGTELLERRPASVVRAIPPQPGDSTQTIPVLKGPAQIEVQTSAPRTNSKVQLLTRKEPRIETASNLTNSAPPPVKRQLADPLARVALAYVGVDFDAEIYWTEAIFDENLPDEERDDLMEDLNEVGFLDPRHPTEEDIPLILNRLYIIEQVAPWADEFMSRHLSEAYKDLLNMLDDAGDL